MIQVIIAIETAVNFLIIAGLSPVLFVYRIVFKSKPGHEIFWRQIYIMTSNCVTSLKVDPLWICYTELEFIIVRLNFSFLYLLYVCLICFEKHLSRHGKLAMCCVCVCVCVCVCECWDMWKEKKREGVKQTNDQS